MSSLFDCQIESVVETTVKMHLQVVHPDQWSVPGDKSFALQTIVDAFWVAKMGYLFGKQPLDDAKLAARAEASPVIDEMEKLLELMHGRKEPISEEEHQALGRGEGTDGLAGWGMSDGVYHKSYPTDYDSFCKASERIIKRVQLVDQIGNPKENEDDPNPSATLVITLSDPAYAAHLVEGAHWETAIYDFSYYRTVWHDGAYFEAERPLPDFTTREKIYDVFEGEQEAGTPDRSAFSGDGSTIFFGSQMGEVVALKDGNEIWRIKPELMFAELSMRNDRVVLNDCGTSRMFSLSDGSELESNPTARTVSNSGAFSVDYGEDETLAFGDGRSIALPDVVEACAFNYDETLVAIGGMFDTVVIANPATAEVVSTIETGERCGHLAFSPDGALLSVGVDGKYVNIYDVSSGQRLVRMGGEHYLTSTTWSPDGQSLIVAHVTDRNGYDGYFIQYPIR